MESLRNWSHSVRNLAGRLRSTAEDFVPVDASKQAHLTPFTSAAQSKIAILAAQLQKLKQRKSQSDGNDCDLWQSLEVCLDLAEIVLVLSFIPEEVDAEWWFVTFYRSLMQAKQQLHLPRRQGAVAAADDADADADDDNDGDVSGAGKEAPALAAAVLDVLDMVASMIYIHDQATRARVFIRALMLRYPQTCVEVCEKVINEASDADTLVLRRLDHDAQSLAQLQQLLSGLFPTLVGVRPLFDEPSSQIRHAHWYQATIMNPSHLVLHVSGSGTRAISTLYRPDISKSEPCYRSNDGNEIVRRVRQVRTQTPLFVWHIRNPKTGALYYGCTSHRDTTIPPGVGWEVLSHGQEPVPSIKTATEVPKEEVPPPAACTLQTSDKISNEYPLVARRQRADLEPNGEADQKKAISNVRSTTRTAAVVELEFDGSAVGSTASTLNPHMSGEVIADSPTQFSADQLQNANVAAEFSHILQTAAVCSNSHVALKHVDEANRARAVLRKQVEESAQAVDHASSEASDLVIARAMQRVPEDVVNSAARAADAHSESLLASKTMNLDALIAAARQNLALQQDHNDNDDDSSDNEQSDRQSENRGGRVSDERFLSRPSLALSEFVGFTKSMAAAQKNRAEVLGAMLFPPDDLEQALVQYMVQISLNEPAPRRERSSSFADPKSSVSEYVGSLVHMMEIQKDSKTRVFTLRRDMIAFSALHADIQAAIQDAEVVGPPFPDPFTIGSNEENYIRVIKSKLKATLSRKNQGSPYTYSSHTIKAEFYRSKTTPSLAAIHGQDVVPLQEGMQRMQHYLQGVLELLEAVDVCLGGNGPQELADAIGAALGRFLMGNNPVPQPSDSSAMHDADQKPLAEDRMPMGRISNASTLSDSSECSRPAWAPFSTGGMEVFLQVQDTQGGKLSLRTEDHMLRAQEHKCFGCGERLLTGLFGFEKNFAPCRYLGRLFCRRWCHADDHRPIPHRILHSWDFQPHRVCRQAAHYLDSIEQNPIICVTFVNPRLFDEVPNMQVVRKLRAQLCSLVELVLDPSTESPVAQHRTSGQPMLVHPDDEAFHEAREIVQQLLGERLHLGVDTEMYSLHDLAAVRSGELMKTLKTAITTLTRTLPVKHLPVGLERQGSPEEVPGNSPTIVPPTL